jgi:hypothetical protein
VTAFGGDLHGQAAARSPIRLWPCRTPGTSAIEDDRHDHPDDPDHGADDHPVRAVPTLARQKADRKPLRGAGRTTIIRRKRRQNKGLSESRRRHMAPKTGLQNRCTTTVLTRHRSSFYHDRAAGEAEWQKPRQCWDNRHVGAARHSSLGSSRRLSVCRVQEVKAVGLVPVFVPVGAPALLMAR